MSALRQDAREALALNRAWWDERALLHAETPLYREHIEALRSGGLSLLPLEQRELGSVEGLDLLHCSATSEQTASPWPDWGRG